MHKLLTPILLAALIACGGPPESTTKTTPTPEATPPRAPWDSFTGDEAQYYTTCSMATDLMRETITSWPRVNLKDSPNPMPMADLPGRFLDVRMGPVGELAALQFKVSAAGKAIYEIGFFQVPAGPNGEVISGTVVDYFTYRDLLLGVIPPGETNPDNVFSSATGEYFCQVK